MQLGLPKAVNGSGAFGPERAFAEAESLDFQARSGLTGAAITDEEKNINSFLLKMGAPSNHSSAVSPVLIVPYMWIGDFVRVHSVVRLLKARWPQRPVDLLTSSLCAPILDYLPGVRRGIVADLPRRSLPIGKYRELAERLKAERYGTALIMPRTWKSALAPFLAGIPERTGFFGEGRVFIVNDLRWGERSLERMIDCFGALALPKGATPPPDWPLPQIEVSQAEVEGAAKLIGAQQCISHRPIAIDTAALSSAAAGPRTLRIP